MKQETKSVRKKWTTVAEVTKTAQRIYITWIVQMFEHFGWYCICEFIWIPSVRQLLFWFDTPNPLKSYKNRRPNGTKRNTQKNSENVAHSLKVKINVCVWDCVHKRKDWKVNEIFYAFKFNNNFQANWISFNMNVRAFQ